MDHDAKVDVKPVPAKPVTFSWTAPDNNGYRVTTQNRSCLWPEWSESAVNSERWGMAAPKPKDKKQATAAASTLSSNELFEEPMGKRMLFSDMESTSWIRLSEYYSSLDEISPVAWDEQEFVFDVLSPNKHLTKFKVLRQMMSALHSLWELGNAGVLLNANHVPGAAGGVGRPWRPWSLVFSMCRTGPGVPHQPLFNPSGKYLVRLFVLGCWRQVCVDDWCPLDREGRPLLLRSVKLTEFWPLVLSKALLQVLSLGRRSSADVEGHEIVAMLTGCVELTVHLRHMKAVEVWKMMQDELLPRYTWPEPPAETLRSVHSATSSARPANSRQKPAEASATADKKGKADKAKSKKPQTQTVVEEKPEEPESVVLLRKKPFVLAMMEDTQGRSCGAADVPLDSELPHLVLVSRYRDVPLEKPPPRPPTPPWKNVRRHLWDPNITNPPRPIQMLEVHTPMLDMPGQWTPSSSELTTEFGEPIQTDATSLTSGQRSAGGATAGAGLLTSESSAPGTTTTKTAVTSDNTNKTISKVATSNAKPSKSSSKPASTDSPKSKVADKAPAAAPVDVKPSKFCNKSSNQEKTVEKKPSATQSLCLEKSSRPLGRVPSPSAPSIIMTSVRETKTWIHMDEFCKVFSRLHLFYSATALKHQSVMSDLVAAPPAPLPAAGSGRAEKERADKAAKSSRMSASSRHSDGEHPLRRLDPTEPLYVFVDILESSRIFISLHVAPPEPPPLPSTPQSVSVADEAVPPPPALVEAHAASVTAESTATPVTAERSTTLGTSEDSVALSENPSSSVASADTAAATAAASSLQAAGTTPLVAAPSAQRPDPTPAAAEPQPQMQFQEQPQTQLQPQVQSQPPSQPKPPHQSQSQPQSQSQSEQQSQSDSGPAPGSELEPPERRGAVVVSEYCWSSEAPGRVLLTLGRRTPDSGAVSLPAGRHVIQLLVTSGRGYALQLGSGSPFRCGTIRDLVQWLAEPPSRYLKAGSDVSDGLLQLMQNFISETSSDHREKMAALCNIFCPVTKPEEKGLRALYQETFFKCLCEVLPQLLGGTMTSESVFPWRCFLMDANHSMQCRRADSPAPSKDRPKSKQRTAAGSTPGKKEVGKSGSTPAAKRTGKPTRDDADRRNGTDDEVVSRGYGSLEATAAVQLQGFARRLLARRMLRSHQSGTADHQRVLAELQRAMPLLQQQTDKLAAEMLRRMLDATRSLMSRYPFFGDLFHTANCTELSGSAPDAGGHGWSLLFRIGFRVVTDQLVAVRPYISASFPIRTHLYDLDRRCLLEPVRHSGYPMQAAKSAEGFCLVAEALPRQGLRPPEADGRWTCWLLDQVHDRGQFSDAKHVALTGCATAFHTKQVVDYYVPRPDQMVFDFYMRAAKGHQLTIQMETSHHKAHVKVQVFDFENNSVASAEGIGQAVIPLFVMDGEECFVPSTNVPGSHDGKKKASITKKDRSGPPDMSRRATSKSRQRSARTGGDAERWTGEGGGSSSGELGRPPRPDNWDRYRLVCRVRADTWPLSRQQWGFVHKLTQQAEERQYLQGPFEFRSQVVLPTGKRQAKKGRTVPGNKWKYAAGAVSTVVVDTSPEPVRSLVEVDRSRPHVALRLVSAEQKADDIELFHNRDHVNAIRLEKAAWETADPGRAERARKLRLEYLDQRTCRLPTDRYGLTPTATPGLAGGDAQPLVGTQSDSATLPSSEEFEPLPEGDPETLEVRDGAVAPEPDQEPHRPAQSSDLERSSDRSRGREPSSTSSGGPQREILYVTPQLPPPFVIHEMDTAPFLRDEPTRLRVCDGQFMAEQGERHSRDIDEFAQRWAAVSTFMAAERSGREQAKLDQMSSLHGSLKPSVTCRAFAEVMRDNYRVRLAETTAAAQQHVEKAGKKKKK